LIVRLEKGINVDLADASFKPKPEVLIVSVLKTNGR